MAKREIEQLRAEIRATRRARSKARPRFETELRERILKVTEERNADGESVEAIAADLGLSIATLSYWRAKRPSEPEKKTALRRIRVVSERPNVATLPILLRGPCGTSVECDSVEMVAQILRRLS